MTANGKVRILISTDYQASGFLCPDSVCVADALLRTSHSPAFSLLEIRIVMPSTEAEDLLLGMLLGQTELSIEHLSPLPEPDATGP
jgi:hypothetical protein